MKIVDIISNVLLPLLFSASLYAAEPDQNFTFYCVAIPDSANSSPEFVPKYKLSNAYQEMGNALVLFNQYADVSFDNYSSVRVVFLTNVNRKYSDTPAEYIASEFKLWVEDNKALFDNQMHGVNDNIGSTAPTESVDDQEVHRTSSEGTPIIQRLRESQVRRSSSDPDRLRQVVELSHGSHGSSSAGLARRLTQGLHRIGRRASVDSNQS